MDKPKNLLFVSAVCSHCRDAIKVAQNPAYAPFVNIELVDQNTDSYKKMQAAGIFQTPTMLTVDGQQIAGASSIAAFLNAYSKAPYTDQAYVQR